MKIKKGIEMWNRAKKIIPGGTQLFSKRSELFLPDGWPSYFKKAKGIKVWDMDGNEFLDFTTMGIGCCILGYADKDVNEAVKKVIDKGNMATLNSPEEIELAELLLEMHPWAGMVRFARTGGEAMAIAVRIARAYTKKDKIAFCGYHGWHDWYLSANLGNDENLDGHLLAGLKPSGVPRCLKDTAFPFNYNRIEELEDIVSKNDIGVIVMEPVRNYYPENNFLEKVREISNKIKAVLIFDEITTGFRMTVGGIHKIFNIVPDIVVYGKAISNGFPMAAIIGKKEIMDFAQESFISSTYWTERIGPVAAITTIKKIKKEDVPSHLIRIGELISKGWKEIADSFNLNIRIMGIPPLTTFIFEHKDTQALQTLFTQEMLKRGYLAGKSVYVSFSHRERDVKEYLKNVEEVFKIIKRAIENNKIYSLLKGPVAESGFKRLT